MRILLLGTDVFTALALKTIISKGYSVLGVITHAEANHTNRIKDIANIYNIPFYVVDNINSEESYKLIKNINPDVIFSVHFDRILKPEICSIAAQCAVNIHPSLLPKYRGLAPFQNVLRYGEKETAITIHYITEKVDEGNIIAQKVLPLTNDMYLFDLYILMMKNYPEVILSALQRLSSGNYAGIEQDKSKASYFDKPEDIDYIINANDSIETAYNKIRAYSKPDKGARFDRFIIWKAKIISKKLCNTPHFYEDKDGLHIFLLDGELQVNCLDYSIINESEICDKYIDTDIKQNNTLCEAEAALTDIIIFQDNFDHINCIIDYIYMQNNYLFTNMFEKKLYDNSYFFILLENILFLIVDYKTYFKIFFWSSNIENVIHSFNAIKSIINDKPNIMEITYKKNNTGNITDKLFMNDSVFHLYGGIFRLKKKIMQSDIHDVCLNIERAVEDDIENIVSLHSKIFNKYIDRELNISELSFLIKSGNVLVYKYKTVICGCLIFTSLGKNAHLRYWFVDKTVQHVKGIGKSLLFELFKITGVGNFIEVWSRKDNTLVYDIYKKYGFVEDGLNSDTYIYSADTSLIAPLNPLN